MIFGYKFLLKIRIITMKLFKILIISVIFFLIKETANASAFEYGYTSDGIKYVIHKHNESSYQHIWCSKHNGIEEYKNSDFTRVDCLTDTHAVEFLQHRFYEHTISK